MISLLVKRGEKTTKKKKFQIESKEESVRDLAKGLFRRHIRAFVKVWSKFMSVSSEEKVYHQSR